MVHQHLSLESHPPRVVLLSGSLSESSRTNRFAEWCARVLTVRGALPELFTGRLLELPLYRPGAAERSPAAQRLLSSIAAADGVILLSPTYHGTVSGLLKNALDYLNELASSPRPYLADRAVGCVAVGAGDMGAVTTLGTLRAICHALRAWPTPLGAAIAGSAVEFDSDGDPTQPEVRERLRTIIGQVLAFTQLSRAAGNPSAQPATVATGTPGSRGHG
ncbi:MAG TPA: NADPH-dependent FMN reductase [Micromonosporaceae bacterium]|jgi:NAD(P)H-dependent FMN reductase|nr:NADPH-dependent FMN reductase [Micromonosporaceae bacterium]